MFKKDNVKNLREKITPRPGKIFLAPPISKSYLPPWYLCILGTVFDEILTSIYLEIAFIFGLQTL